MMPINEESARNYVAKLKDLPTLPQVLAKAMQIVSNPLSSASDLNEVIALDQALTAKVLRLANSAYYGFPQEITSVTQAVVILGFNTIRNLALTVSVHKMLFEGAKQGKFSYRDFWIHSVGTAVACKRLAKKVGFKSEENAFTAGLLHDIGKNFFEQQDAAAYAEVLDHSQQAGLSLWCCEKERFGIDHAQVGGWMAEKWNLQPELTAAIRLHHQPDPSRSDSFLVCLVHVANQLCRRLQVGSAGDRGGLELDPEVLDCLGVNEADLARMENDIFLSLAEAENFFTPGSVPAARVETR
jgi:putative nucleotidyltransferase with HDIG domain